MGSYVITKEGSFNREGTRGRVSYRSSRRINEVGFWFYDKKYVKKPPLSKSDVYVR